MNHGLKCKIIKHLGKKQRRKTLGLSAGQRVLRHNIKSTIHKRKKINKLDFIKINLQETVKTTKDKRMGQNIRKPQI